MKAKPWAHPLTTDANAGTAAEKYARLRKLRREAFDEKMRLLVRLCPAKVKKCETLWECEYNLLRSPRHHEVTRDLPEVFERLKVDNSDLISFLKKPVRPMHLMVIRDSFQSALTETYAMRYVKEEHFGNAFALDVSSLYPFVGIQYRMPCGEYKMIVGDDLVQDEITFDHDAEVMLHKNVPLFGIVHCRVISPCDLLYPFLQTRIGSQVIGTLCRTCAEQMEQVKKCTHSYSEKYFEGTWTSQELCYAYFLGYRFYYYQIMAYSETTSILQPFLSLLAYQKLRHCHYPSHVQSEEEKKDYCKDISEKMKFKDIIKKQLTPDMVYPNPEQRNFYKASLNSFLGSFGVNVEKLCSVNFVTSHDRFMEKLATGRIKAVEPLSEDVLQVTLSNQEKTPSRTSNVVVSAFITSIARSFVHKKIMELYKLGAIILRVSTDCIYFVMPDGQHHPYETSEAFGHFKEQLQDVEAVIQLGPRTMSVLHREDGVIKEKFTTCGTAIYSDTKLTHDTFSSALDLLIADELKELSQYKVTQVRKESGGIAKKAKVQVREHALFNANFIQRRRVCVDSTYYESEPYGFNLDG